MVSFFGEVVFPSSRAFWDEDEEDGNNENTVNQCAFTVRWVKNKPSHIKTLFVIESEMLIDFAKSCLCQNSEEICVVEDERQKKVFIVHQINKDVCLCMVSPWFDVKYSGKLVEKIFDIISSAENTISLISYHVSKFKSDEVPNVPSFLRMLSTKSGESFCKFKAPLLERPNIAFGVTAGVLSYAEFMGLPSILYILYTDNFVLDSKSVEPLLKLFTVMNCMPSNATLTGKGYFNKGNLYM